MLKLCALTACVLLPSAATAQAVQGFYVSGEAGPSFEGSLLASRETTKVHTTVGPVGLAALGWQFGDGIRAEIEGGYRSNGITNILTRRVNGLLEPLGDVTGNAANYAVMTNFAYDIPLHPFGLPMQPYVGTGIGYGWFDFNQTHGNGFGTLRLSDNNTFTGPVAVNFGAAGGFAYQAMVGAALPIHGAPGLSLTAEYRFFGTARADIPVTRISTSGDLVNGSVPSGATHNGFETHESSLMIGARYRFGAR